MCVGFVFSPDKTRFKVFDFVNLHMPLVQQTLSQSVVVVQVLQYLLPNIGLKTTRHKSSVSRLYVFACSELILRTKRRSCFIPRQRIMLHAHALRYISPIAYTHSKSG